jgi:renalase
VSRRRVLVLGAGMAGLTAARLLAAEHDVVVLDKGRGVGGRMATRRIGEGTFDHGAQFVTTHTAEFAATVQALVDENVASPWFRGRIGPDGLTGDDGHTRFRGTVSMNAVAKHLARGLDVRTASRVAALGHDDRAWHVVLDDGDPLDADAVVVTAPVPQALDLLAAGGVVLSPGDADALSRITYDPCLALMVLLDGPSGLAEPGAVDPTDGPIDWMADNQLKGVSEAPAVTIHATPGFSRAHWESDDQVVVDELLAAAGLASAPLPGQVQIQRWRHAKPEVGHPERCLVAAHLPPLVVAGDAFGGAKVEGAALSGVAAAEALRPVLA